MSSEPAGSATQAAPWDRLRVWIDEKQAWERENGRPAPLSPRELKAIAELVPVIPEPDVGDVDHVSVLLSMLAQSYCLLPSEPALPSI